VDYLKMNEHNLSNIVDAEMPNFNQLLQDFKKALDQLEDQLEN